MQSVNVKSFSANLIAKGVKAVTDTINANQSQVEFFSGLKRVKVDAANVKEYKAEFSRVVMAYLDTKYESKVKVEKWLKDNADLKGAAETPFLKGKGKQAGKPYTKRDLESMIRAMSTFWMDTYVRFLKGNKKDSGSKTEKGTFVKDIEAAWPRMAALQKLEAPTSNEVAAIKLWKAIIDHAVASDPEALKLRNKKLENALKFGKK